MGGYLFFSTTLFVIWSIVFVFFDSQTYLEFTPHQLTVKQHIGQGQNAYLTIGMLVEKPQSDLFRHVILGFGSGDIVKPATGSALEWRNVLFVGRRVRQITDMLKEQVVIGPGAAGIPVS